MAVTAKKLYASNAVPNTATTAYTVPGSTTTILKNIVICNSTASPITATITAGGANIVSGLSIAANSTTTLDLSAVLNAADTISVTAGAATGLSMLISGVEVV